LPSKFSAVDFCGKQGCACPTIVQTTIKADSAAHWARRRVWLVRDWRGWTMLGIPVPAIYLTPFGDLRGQGCGHSNIGKRITAIMGGTLALADA